MILESLGVEKYLEEHLNSSNYLLRVMKYKGPETSDTKLGLSSHTDRNIVTILYQNEVEGLEVMTKDGKWISYKPSLNSFVVMIGDSLHVIIYFIHLISLTTNYQLLIKVLNHLCSSIVILNAIIYYI